MCIKFKDYLQDGKEIVMDSDKIVKITGDGDDCILIEDVDGNMYRATVVDWIRISFVKITVGMTGEFEIIKTNAPKELLEKQLWKNNKKQEDGEKIDDSYDLLKLKGYYAVVVVDSDSGWCIADEFGVDYELDYCDYDDEWWNTKRKR